MQHVHQLHGARWRVPRLLHLHDDVHDDDHGTNNNDHINIINILLSIQRDNPHHVNTADNDVIHDYTCNVCINNNNRNNEYIDNNKNDHNIHVNHNVPRLLRSTRQLLIRPVLRHKQPLLCMHRLRYVPGCH